MSLEFFLNLYLIVICVELLVSSVVIVQHLSRVPCVSLCTSVSSFEPFHLLASTLIGGVGEVIKAVVS